MAGRPRKDAAARVDPKTGGVLPEGIRYLVARDRYQIRTLVRSVGGEWVERTRTFETLAQAKGAREGCRSVVSEQRDLSCILVRTLLGCHRGLGRSRHGARLLRCLAVASSTHAGTREAL